MSALFEIRYSCMFVSAEHDKYMTHVILQFFGIVLSHHMSAHIKVPLMGQQTTNCSSIPRVMLLFFNVAYYFTEQ